MQNIILESLKFNTKKIDEINSADIYFFKLIFDEIGKKINLLEMVKNLSDDKVLSIAKQMPLHDSQDEKHTLINTRNYIELMVKNLMK